MHFFTFYLILFYFIFSLSADSTDREEQDSQPGAETFFSQCIFPLFFCLSLPLYHVRIVYNGHSINKKNYIDCYWLWLSCFMGWFLFFYSSNELFFVQTALNSNVNLTEFYWIWFYFRVEPCDCTTPHKASQSGISLWFLHFKSSH